MVEDRNENKINLTMYVLALLCVVNAVMVPMMLVMLLARYDRQHRRQEKHYATLQRRQEKQNQFVTKTLYSHFTYQKLEELIADYDIYIQESQPGGHSQQKLQPRPARPSPLTMRAAVSSTLRGQLSHSDSSLTSNVRRRLSPVREEIRRKSGQLSHSDSSLTSNVRRSLSPVRENIRRKSSDSVTQGSPVFARMLANTREAPATPLNHYSI